MSEALHHMGSSSLIALICWIFFMIVCIITYFKNQKLTPYFLFLSAVSIAAAFALFSPYLYDWDEQFHALVAKNLSKNPFVPKLIPHHPLNINQDTWLSGIIWTHKQPLFTWQMALSIKLFGTNTFAFRLPSVLFHGALVIAIFRIGTIVFNRKTGFIAALLVMHAAYLLGLISGRIGTDHNDFIFLCYITFSFWAWFEWSLSKNKKWLYWIGIFVGCAILTKWLVGLLVFAGWTITLIPELRKGNWWNSLKPLFISFGVSMLVSMPWQIYTYLRFPLEFKREMAYNSKHVSHALENHVGDAWYHFDQIRHIYFNPFDFLIVFLISLIFLIRAKNVKKTHQIFILVSIGIIYAFFTIVQTKMPSFTIPVFGFVMLIIAFGLTEITKLIPYKWVNRIALILVTALLVNWILKPTPTLNNYDFYRKPEEIVGKKNLLKAYQFMRKNGSSTGKRIVFGVDFFPFSHISWMVYNDEIAYPFIPSESEVIELKRKGYDVVVIRDRENPTKVNYQKSSVLFLNY
jgi:4-amino-4-deoxy-L-arabinose transferase-like glycosyltransferase